MLVGRLLITEKQVLADSTGKKLRILRNQPDLCG